MSLMETTVLTIDSTSPEIDGLICVAASSCALTDVLVYLFCSGVEVKFCPFCFPCGIDVDPTDMLMTSSRMDVGQTGDSRSLEISIVSEVLSMPHQYTSLV